MIHSDSAISDFNVDHNKLLCVYKSSHQYMHSSGDIKYVLYQPSSQQGCHYCMHDCVVSFLSLRGWFCWRSLPVLTNLFWQDILHGKASQPSQPPCRTWLSFNAELIHYAVWRRWQASLVFTIPIAHCARTMQMLSTIEWTNAAVALAVITFKTNIGYLVTLPIPRSPLKAYQNTNRFDKQLLL